MPDRKRPVRICSECEREAKEKGLPTPEPLPIFNVELKLCSKHNKARLRKQKRAARITVPLQKRQKLWTSLDKAGLLAREWGFFDEPMYLEFLRMIDAIYPERRYGFAERIVNSIDAVTITERDGEYHVSSDPESAFDSLEDARRFVLANAAMRKT